jgi:hypothetical protein
MFDMIVCPQMERAMEQKRGVYYSNVIQTWKSLPIVSLVRQLSRLQLGEDDNCTNVFYFLKRLCLDYLKLVRKYQKHCLMH